MTVIINNWQFEPGDREHPSNQYLRGARFEPRPRGWHCRAYPRDREMFLTWMGQNCPTAECTVRFNSGDPMVEVYIQDDHEAVLFQLRWAR